MFTPPVVKNPSEESAEAGDRLTDDQVLHPIGWTLVSMNARTLCKIAVRLA
jgi:hypothetical protein